MSSQIKVDVFNERSNSDSAFTGDIFLSKLKTIFGSHVTLVLGRLDLVLKIPFINGLQGDVSL